MSINTTRAASGSVAPLAELEDSTFDNEVVSVVSFRCRGPGFDVALVGSAPGVDVDAGSTTTT